MADLLRMDYINSLPQPFIADLGPMMGRWPVETIAVDAPSVRIDVCGLLQVISMSDVRQFIDAAGVIHDPDTFWSDYEEASHG